MPRATQVPQHEVIVFSATGLSPSSTPLSSSFTCTMFYNSAGHPLAALQPRLKRFGLFPFRSPLLGESLLISLPALLRWFTSRSLALPRYFIRVRSAHLSACGLPHSGTLGSKDVCSSPRLFAACRALLRTVSPGRPPRTSYSLGHIVPSRARHHMASSARPSFSCVSFPVYVKYLFYSGEYRT